MSRGPRRVTLVNGAHRFASPPTEGYVSRPASPIAAPADRMDGGFEFIVAAALESRFGPPESAGAVTARQQQGYGYEQ